MIRSLGRVFGLLAVVVAACSGPGATPTQAPSVPPPPGASTSAASAVALPTTAATPAIASGSAPSATPGTAGNFAPGPVGFRIVHLYRRPDGTAPAIEIFARTDGIVEAFSIRSGATIGSVTDYIHPPSGGGVIAMETGGDGKPTCVVNCTHFVVDASSASGEGDRRTILVYPESSSFIAGQTPSDLAGTIEFWEDPKPASIGQTGNALMPADASQGLLFVVAAPVEEARFGLRLAFAGRPGCQENLNLPGVMVGGNQVPAFAVKGDVRITLHASGDRGCSKAPVGGPFSVSGTGGSRAYLFLYGTLADLKALLVPID